jgi:hypothetical protein
MKNLLAFIMAIFGQIATDAKIKFLLCGFPDNPDTNKYWTARTMRGEKPPKVIRKTNNNYIQLATFRQTPEGGYRAKNKYVEAYYALVLDDIGTKIKKSLPLPPSWKIETSPGNFQVGYILKEPCTDLQLYEAVFKALGKEGFCDTGAAGPVRWVRLPLGVNTKDKYLVDGVPPQVKFVELHKDLRYSLEEIIEAYELDIKSVTDTYSAEKTAKSLERSS